MNISLDAIVFPDTATATVSKTVTDFFAGKSEAEIQKYISLCRQADAFKTDKKKGDCSEYPTAAFCLYGIIFYPVVLLSLFSLTSLVSRHIAVHEQYHRPAGAGGVGTEAAVIVAGGDALFNSPGDRLLIRLCNGRGICEACYTSACCGLALVTPEEGHELRSRYAVIGTEGAVIIAGGDTLLDSPGHRFLIRRRDGGGIIEHTCIARGLGTARGAP